MYVHMYKNTNKIEQNYSEMHPKTVQKQLLSTGTVPGTELYRQEYLITIRFFQKKTDVYRTNVTYGNSNL